jgi:hypothetical protein
MNNRREAYYKGAHSRPYYPAKNVAPGPEFWEGPYGMMVPGHIDMVPYTDGGNLMYKDGTITNAYVTKPKIDQHMYMAIYGKQGRDGRWYYDDKKANKMIF